MTDIDLAILAVLVISAILGTLRGFLREAIGLASWLIALWVAWKHNDLVASYLGGALAAEPLRTWAARAITLIAVLLVGTVVGVVANQLVRVSIFSGFDRLLGLLFGLLRGIVVLGLATIVAQQLRLDKEPWWTASRLIPYVTAAGTGIRVLVGETARGLDEAATGAAPGEKI